MAGNNAASSYGSTYEPVLLSSGFDGCARTPKEFLRTFQVRRLYDTIRQIESNQMGPNEELCLKNTKFGDTLILSASQLLDLVKDIKNEDYVGYIDVDGDYSTVGQNQSNCTIYPQRTDPPVPHYPNPVVLPYSPVAVATPQPKRNLCTSRVKWLIVGNIAAVLMIIGLLAVVMVLMLKSPTDFTKSTPSPTGPPADSILIFGGATTRGLISNTVQSYPEDSLNLTQGIDLLQSGCRGASGVLGYTVVIKFSLTLDNKPTSKVQLFDTSDWHVRYAKDAPNNYADAAGAIFQNRFYLIGGIDEKSIKNDCNYLNSDFSSWNKCPKMPDIRVYHSVVALDDALYLFGGEGGGENATTLQTVYKLNYNSGNWKTVKDIPTPANFMGATTYENRIVACGGAILEGSQVIPLNDCQAYDSFTNSWTNMTSMNRPRWLFNLVNFNDSLYALGGTTTGGVPDNSVEVYDDLSDPPKWVNSDPFSEARWGALAVAV